MIPSVRWLTIPSDPLRQLVDDFSQMHRPVPVVALSQAAALIHWPFVESSHDEVSIILRRCGREDEAEWQDQLALLRQLLLQSGKPVHLLALNDDAASALSDEMEQPVTALAALPRLYSGDRYLRLSRASGLLQIERDHSVDLAAWPFNLARLRRVSVLDTSDADADLSDVIEYANGTAAVARPEPTTAPVVFVVVPNGFGLGHVTRMLALAQRFTSQCNARVIFWSFSRAAGIISQFGFETVSRHTARHLGADIDAWRRWETKEFAAALRQFKPDLVIQDAAALEDFVVDALVQPEAGSARLALIRRGMWQKGILGTDPLASEDLADMILEPGDLASSADQGVTRGRAATKNRFARIDVSAPVTLVQPNQMLDRKPARKALGLGRGRHVLVSLGGDAFNDWSHLVRHLTNAAVKARVRLVWARSPLAALDADIGDNHEINTRNVYPLARYLAAFDGVVSAAGYNSFHELMQLCDLPVLFAPRLHPTLDDQVARASFAASQGWAMHAGTFRNEDSAVSAFLEDVRAAKTFPSRPTWSDGAAEMSDMLMTLIEAGTSQR